MIQVNIIIITKIIFIIEGELKKHIKWLFKELDTLKGDINRLINIYYI